MDFWCYLELARFEPRHRPGPSTLAHLAGPGTASAPAGLTTGRPAASHTGHPSDGNPALTGRRFPHACVTRKRQILNHPVRRIGGRDMRAQATFVAKLF